MNMLDARALRYDAQEKASQTPTTSPTQHTGDGPPAGWREIGKTKNVNTTDDWSAMMGGKVNKLMQNQI